jgi:hypothetical protein
MFHERSAPQRCGLQQIQEGKTMATMTDGHLQSTA